MLLLHGHEHGLRGEERHGGKGHALWAHGVGEGGRHSKGQAHAAHVGHGATHTLQGHEVG